MRAFDLKHASYSVTSILLEWSPAHLICQSSSMDGQQEQGELVFWEKKSRRNNRWALLILIWAGPQRWSGPPPALRRPLPWRWRSASSPAPASFPLPPPPPALARFLSTTAPSHPSPNPEGTRGEAYEGAPLPWRSWRPDVAWLSKDWSLSDLTIGLYLIYLSQASAKDAQSLQGCSHILRQQVIRRYHPRVSQHTLEHMRLPVGTFAMSWELSESVWKSIRLCLTLCWIDNLRMISLPIGILTGLPFSTVLQDDIIPRVSVLEKEDWKHIVDIVTNARLVVSSIQDVARKFADYAKTVTVSASSDGVKEAGRPPSSTEVLLCLRIFSFLGRSTTSRVVYALEG
ncbi:hypothetical protein ABZP36_035723 [Zizania latifolia]